MDAEKTFLHSLANPITSLFFLVEVTLEHMETHTGTHPEDLARLKKVYETLGEVERLLSKRREVVKNS